MYMYYAVGVVHTLMLMLMYYANGCGSYSNADACV